MQPFEEISPSTPKALREVLARQHADGLLGDAYLEFGVYQGRTLACAETALRELGAAHVRIVGFDSFQGLPAPGEHDWSQALEPGMAACAREDVEARLTAAGTDLSRIELVEGFYSRSLTAAKRADLGVERPGVILIDCDLYESTRDVLAFVRPMLAPGAVLMFDDWNLSGKSDARGQRRAMAEFAASGVQAEDLFSYGWHGQAVRVAAVQVE